MQPTSEPGPPRRTSNLDVLMMLAALVAIAMIAIAVVKKGSPPATERPADGMPPNTQTGR